jgi:metal-responsive CopG/Arc/MetJ family transcriptional regulator
MVKKRISLGIRLKDDLVDKLDKMVNHLDHINPTRSELIESIITAFFKSEFDHIEKGRELILTKRKDKIVHPVHNLSEKPHENPNF